MVRKRTDIVKRKIAKSVRIQHLAFINGVGWINGKFFCNQVTDLINFILELRDDAYAHYVSNLTQITVVLFWFREFLRQFVLLFDSSADRMNFDFLFVEQLLDQLLADALKVMKVLKPIFKFGK